MGEDELFYFKFGLLFWEICLLFSSQEFFVQIQQARHDVLISEVLVDGLCYLEQPC